MTGSKPKVMPTTSELKKMRAAEAEARKRKTSEASDVAPSKKKRKIKKKRAAPTEPLVVEPISVVRPTSEHQERRMIVHEPASTEAHQAEDIPAVEPTAAEHIGHLDNVEMMMFFLRSSTTWYHHLCLRTANSSALVVL